MASSDKNLFTPREVLSFINNAVAAAFKPKSGEIPEDRLRRLHAYTLALVGPVREHMETEYLRPEEMVLILLCAAMVCQCQDVMDIEVLPKFPMLQGAKVAAGE